MINLNLLTGKLLSVCTRWLSLIYQLYSYETDPLCLDVSTCNRYGSRIGGLARWNARVERNRCGNLTHHCQPTVPCRIHRCRFTLLTGRAASLVRSLGLYALHQLRTQIILRKRWKGMATMDVTLHLPCLSVMIPATAPLHTDTIRPEPWTLTAALLF